MKNEIIYEWTLEELDPDGDIIDSDFSDTLTFDDYDPDIHALGLVRNTGNDRDGVTDRLWAYVKNGELPVYFADSMGVDSSLRVPQRFHDELFNYLSI